MKKCTNERNIILSQCPASTLLRIFALAAIFLPMNLGAQTVIIDSQWLNSRQPPYKLTGNAATYKLETDVVSKGTAFLFADTGITFDLNGHSITYADMEFKGIHNPGFELAAAGNPEVPDGWDLSGAPHAKRQNYLDKLYFDDWSLRLENPAGDSLAREYARSPEVYLPAAGRYAAIAQVQGEPYNAVQVTLSIEGTSATLDNLISNNAMTNKGTDMSVGIIAEFTVSAPCYVRVRVNLETTDPSISTSANIDEVDVRPIGLYGIARDGWNKTMAEIRNGTIREGRSQAIYSHAIFQTGGARIHDLTIITNGINSSNIWEKWAGGLQIYNNHLEANGKLPLHRHYFFSMIDLEHTPGGNDIYDNILLYGPHVGINHGNANKSNDNPSRSRIHHNTIKTRIVATNGFSIFVGSNVDVFSNTIQPLQGHGIGLGSGSNNVKIYDNLIEPRSWPCSEYSTYFYPNASHGIRIKTYASGNLKDVEITNNRIIGRTIPVKSNCYTIVSGITNYVTDSNPSTDPNPSNISISGNNVQVYTDNYLQQHAVAYTAGPYGSVSQNTFASNHIIIAMSNADAGVAQNVRLLSNTLEKLPSSSGFNTLRFGYNRPTGSALVDTRLLGGASLKDMLYTRTYSPPSDFSVSWALTVKANNPQGNPIQGASVSIEDKNGVAVADLKTDEAGKAVFELKEYTCFYDKAVRYEYAAPYRAKVYAPGFPEKQATITLDRSMEKVFTMGGADNVVAAPYNLQVK
jgi:hypothetical protein